LKDRFFFTPDYASLTVFVRQKGGSGWKMTLCNAKPAEKSTQSELSNRI
jgi:hypothetical protein